MKYITEERLSIYSKHLKISKKHELSAYHWNKALAGALLPAVQCLEVTLRNAIIDAVEKNPPAAAKGSYSTDHDWIFSFTQYMGKKKLKPHQRYTKKPRNGQIVDSNGYVLANNGERLIVKYLWEEKKVIDSSKRLMKEGKAVTAGRVISSMDFGFWTNFLSKEYEDKKSKMLLWPNQIDTVFPNAPKGISRADIEYEFKRIRELRNRLTHHEAIWKFFYDDEKSGKPDYRRPVYGVNASCSLLLKHYEDILKLIGWMSQERLNDFISHQSDSRFRSLCSVNGLKSFTEPEQLPYSYPLSKGGWALKKVVRNINNNEWVCITRLGQVILTIGKDCNRSF